MIPTPRYFARPVTSRPPRCWAGRVFSRRHITLISDDAISRTHAADMAFLPKVSRAGGYALRRLHAAMFAKGYQVGAALSSARFSSQVQADGTIACWGSSIAIWSF